MEVSVHIGDRQDTGGREQGTCYYEGMVSACSHFTVCLLLLCVEWRSINTSWHISVHQMYLGYGTGVFTCVWLNGGAFVT